MAENGTIAYVHTMPSCNFYHKDLNTAAEFDFRTQGGSWAYGCEKHWLEHRMHVSLGTGKGQKLELRRD